MSVQQGFEIINGGRIYVMNLSLLLHLVNFMHKSVLYLSNFITLSLVVTEVDGTIKALLSCLSFWSLPS